MRLPRIFNVLTCVVKSAAQCFPNLPGRGSILLRRIAGDSCPGQTSRRTCSLDKAESFPALKKSLAGLPNQGAQANSPSVPPLCLWKRQCQFPCVTWGIGEWYLTPLVPTNPYFKGKEKFQVKGKEKFLWVSPKSRVPRVTQGYRLIPRIWRKTQVPVFFLPSLRGSSVPTMELRSLLI